MSRTIRRKNGCHHFWPGHNAFNPYSCGYRTIKVEDGVEYIEVFTRIRKSWQLVVDWVPVSEFVEAEKKAYYQRWGRFEHRDKKVLRHYSKSLKQAYNRAGRNEKRKQLHRLFKDPESDYLFETEYQKGILWDFT